jgi:hypothetical protein
MNNEENKIETETLEQNKKKHIKKKDLAPEIRKKKRIVKLIITLSVIGLIVVLFGAFSLAGFIGNRVNLKKINSIEKVGSNLTPKMDEETGYWTFTTDNEFKVLQLTDIHIGAGVLSKDNDEMAINAVSTLIRRVKPDLVIVTGDTAYPVPFQAGTFNNLREAELFATLMEKLEVY